MSTVSFERCKDYDRGRLYDAVSSALEATGPLERILGKKGGSVIIKPNMMAAHPPHEHVCTHPEVVRAVIRIVKDYGSRPLVGDSPAGLIGKWDIDNVWKVSEIEQVVKEEGAEKVVFERHEIRKIPTPYLDKLDEHLITEYVFECDAVINLPKWKTHTYMIMSGAAKNLFGFVPGKWKGEIHCRAPFPEDFGKIIASLSHIIKPCTSIMDAVYGLEGDGPSTAGKIRKFGWIIAGDDPISIDTVIARLMGLEWRDIPVLKAAGENNWGEVDIDKVQLKGISLQQDSLNDILFPKKVVIKNLERFTRMIYAPTRVYPSIIQDKCKRCLKCYKSCPAKALQLDDNKQLYVDPKKCIECCCCYEVCISKAIDLYGGNKQCATSS
ncbi:MAG: DUF362 domain-containing protein [Nitrospirota bacterium]|nr:DUF362 domain-containing protein [Nitrospirota bacterium]